MIDDELFHLAMQKSIADAVLNEHERCAKICDTAEQLSISKHGKNPSIEEYTAACVASELACNIRKG